MTKQRKGRSPGRSMTVIRPHVAGIDIGSREHWVCGPPLAEGEACVKVFGTSTPQLHALADWLEELGVESVAMESTHVYWIPIYELLESRGFEVVLANARQLHHVPGRKTDMNDCQWLQQLHSCGLLRGSFRPGEQICALRALHRHLGNLVAERTRSVQWMQKALDQMNVQVHRAVTDLSGKTGMAIVRAIVAGERSPQELARLRHGRCRKSEEEIAELLTGTWREEHLFNLSAALRHFDFLKAEIERYEEELLRQTIALQPEERREQTAPQHPSPRKRKALAGRSEEEQRVALWRLAGVDLTRIDGISAKTASTVIHEIGLDLSAFPNEKHFVSWLRLSPRVPISGGKPVRKRRNSMGANRVSGALRMAALSALNSDTALGAHGRSVARRKGGAVAVFALARKLAVLVYRMLRYGQDYVDVGQQAYEEIHRDRRIRRLRQTATQLGFQLTPQEDPAPSLA